MIGRNLIDGFPDDGYHDLKHQLRDHVYRRYRSALADGAKARACVGSEAQRRDRAAMIRQALLDSMGGVPEITGPVLSQMVGTVRKDGYRAESIVLFPRPGVPCSAVLYVPEASPPLRGHAAVLFLCGHSEEGKCDADYVAACSRIARAGLMVLAIDPVGQGERLGYYDTAASRNAIPWGCPEHNHVGCQCLPIGDGLARYFLHDALRAVDFLISRPDVDARRIGVTGNSGGGMQTTLLMMADARIAAAAPATFIMDLESNLLSGLAQDQEQIWRGLVAKGFDHEDILLCFAPRPLLVLAASWDFFPIEGTHRTVSASRKYWEMNGRAETLEFFEQETGHRFTLEMADRVADFFRRHLDVSVRDSGIAESWTDRQRHELLCSQEGQLECIFPGMRTVFDENLNRTDAKLLLQSGDDEELHVEKAHSWLREQVVIDRGSCPLFPRWVDRGHLQDMKVDSLLYRVASDLFAHALCIRKEMMPTEEAPVVALWDQGTRAIERHLGLIRDWVDSGRVVLIFDPPGIGALEPYPVNGLPVDAVEGTLFHFSIHLLELGDSLCALRIDALRLLLENLGAWVGWTSIHGRPILYTEGKASILGECAAFIGALHLEYVEVDPFPSSRSLIRSELYDGSGLVEFILPEHFLRFDYPDLRRWNDGKTIRFE